MPKAQLSSRPHETGVHELVQKILAQLLVGFLQKRLWSYPYLIKQTIAFNHSMRKASQLSLFKLRSRHALTC